MGVYDFVLFERGVDLPEWPLDVPPWRHSWQTRAFPDRAYRLHCITEDGHLYRVDHTYGGGGLVARNEEPQDTHDFVERVYKEPDWDGHPRDVEEVDWYRVRFVRDMVVTCQNRDEYVSYEIDFDRHDIAAIERFRPE